MKWHLVFLLVFLSIAACKNQQGETIANNPKVVSLHWQKMLNNNQFAEAKKWSTKNTVEILDWIEQKMLPEDLAEINPPLYIEGDCVESGDRATCVYLMEDNGELYQDSIFLVKINGQWLVDIPEENLIQDASMDQIYNELEELLKEDQAIEK